MSKTPLPAATGDVIALAPEGRRRAATPRKATVLRHEDKRVAILSTSARLFATRGYEATSLDMIADQLGMHKATLYHYISSKDEVLYQCLVKSFEDLDAVIEATKDRSVPVFDRLRHFALHLARAQNNEFGRCLLLVGPRPLGLGPGNKIREFQRKLDVTVRALLEQGIASGIIKPRRPGLITAMLFGALNWVPQWYKADGAFTLEEVVQCFMDSLIDGIATKSFAVPMPAKPASLGKKRRNRESRSDAPS